MSIKSEKATHHSPGRRRFLTGSTLALGVITISPWGKLLAAASKDTVSNSVRFELDDLHCAILKVGQFDMSPKELFPQASAEELTKLHLNVDTIPFGIHSLFVDTGKNRIIIEPGGIDEPDKLVSKLVNAGIDPASIDTVIITHAHYDHFFGCVKNSGELAFPNARYYLQKREWDYWSNTKDGEPNLLLQFNKILRPIEKQFTFLDGDVEIVPGIHAMLTPGHSPWHMSVHVGKTLAYTGDAILQPVQVVHPEWIAAFNHWPEQVLESRRKFLKRVAEDKALVVATHFPTPAAGRVIANGDRLRWVPEEL